MVLKHSLAKAQLYIWQRVVDLVVLIVWIFLWVRNLLVFSTQILQFGKGKTKWSLQVFMTVLRNKMSRKQDFLKYSCLCLPFSSLMIIQYPIYDLQLTLTLILNPIQLNSISLTIWVKILVQKKFLHLLIDPWKIVWNDILENYFILFFGEVFFWKWDYFWNTWTETLVDKLRMICH